MRHKIKSLLLLVLMLPVGLIAAAQNEMKVLTYEEAKGITYKWPITTEEKSAIITEEATDPGQIIALLRTIYTNKQIPGIYQAAYTNEDVRERTVYYGPIYYTYYNNTYALGWNIIGSGEISPTATDFKPETEGYTMLLVKVKDSFDKSKVSTAASSVGTYEQLYNFIDASIESVQLLYDGVYTGNAESKYDNGVLFNINASNVNRFFVLSKGQARQNGNIVSELAPFGQMFEQFSPTSTAATGGQGGYYTGLIVNKESHKVQHDCNSVLVNVHDFMMSGSATGQHYDLNNLLFFVPDYRLKYWETGSGSRKYDGRKTENSNSSSKYVNYNQTYAPTLVMYNVVLNAEAVQEGDASNHEYRVNLNWNSNIKKYAPNLHQKYDIFLVIDGKIQETPLNSQPLEIDQEDYTYVVPQHKAGYSITYVVRAHPQELIIDEDGNETYKERFALQYSNQATVIIPGYDKQERLQLMIDRDYFSHYDVQNQVNQYWNKIPMNNGVGTDVKIDFITDEQDNESTFEFKRIVNGEEIAVADVKITKINSHQSGGGTLEYSISMINQVIVDSKQNPSTTGTFTYDKDGTIDFGHFYICDQFTASTVDNSHPEKYQYKVYFKAAKDFEVDLYNDAGEIIGHTNTSDVYSNVVDIPIYKTASEISNNTAYNRVQIDGDSDNAGDQVRHLQPVSSTVYKEDASGENNPVKITFKTDVQKSTTTEIFTYDVNHGTGMPNEKFSYAQNYDGETYFINNDQSTSVNAPGAAEFTDEVENACEMFYVPVINVFAPKGDRDCNTYGCDVKKAVIGKLNVKVHEADEKEYPRMTRVYKWEDKDNNYVYSYYNYVLDFNTLDIPAGYELYKVRAWRKVTGWDTQGNAIDNGVLLRERLFTRRSRSTLDDNGEYLFEEITYGDDLGKRDADGNHVEATMKLAELYDAFLKTSKYELGSRYTSITPDLFDTDTEPWTYGDEHIQEEAVRNEMRGTFGALRLKTAADEGDDRVILSKIKAEFYVRAYFTKTSQNSASNLSPRLNMTADDMSVDGKYYIAEGYCEAVDDVTNIITGVTGISANGEVSGVMYYNTMGLPSVTPWQGVNIVVTRYTDGTTSTTKVVR